MKKTKTTRMLNGLFIALFLAGCAASTPLGSDEKSDLADGALPEWGIRLDDIRLAAAGHLIDFRYQVTDPHKALNLMKRGENAFLIDQSTGTRQSVPVTKVGQLRGTGTLPIEGRTYAVMFNNESGLIHKGSMVTVVIGEFRAENLTVQ